MLILVPGLILLTASAVTAFGVFFFANQTTGRLKTFGNALGIWVMAMGVLAIALATFGAASGRHHMRGHRGHLDRAPVTQPSAAPASIAPAP